MLRRGRLSLCLLSTLRAAIVSLKLDPVALPAAAVPPAVAAPVSLPADKKIASSFADIVKDSPFYSRFVREANDQESCLAGAAGSSSHVNDDQGRSAQKLCELLFSTGMACPLAEATVLFPKLASPQFLEVLRSGKGVTSCEGTLQQPQELFYAAAEDTVADWSTEGFLRRGYQCINKQWRPVNVVAARLGWVASDITMAAFLVKFAKQGLVELGTQGSIQKAGVSAGLQQLPAVNVLTDFTAPLLMSQGVMVRRIADAEEALLDAVRLDGDAAVHPPKKGNRSEIEIRYYAAGTLNYALRSLIHLEAASNAAGVANPLADAVKKLQPTKQARLPAGGAAAPPTPPTENAKSKRPPLPQRSQVDSLSTSSPAAAGPPAQAGQASQAATTSSIPASSDVAAPTSTSEKHAVTKDEYLGMGKLIFQAQELLRDTSITFEQKQLVKKRLVALFEMRQNCTIINATEHLRAASASKQESHPPPRQGGAPSTPEVDLLALKRHLISRQLEVNNYTRKFEKSGSSHDKRRLKDSQRKLLKLQQRLRTMEGGAEGPPAPDSLSKTTCPVSATPAIPPSPALPASEPTASTAQQPIVTNESSTGNASLGSAALKSNPLPAKSNSQARYPLQKPDPRKIQAMQLLSCSPVGPVALLRNHLTLHPLMIQLSKRSSPSSQLTDEEKLVCVRRLNLLKQNLLSAKKPQREALFKAELSLRNFIKQLSRPISVQSNSSAPSAVSVSLTAAAAVTASAPKQPAQRHLATTSFVSRSGNNVKSPPDRTETIGAAVSDLVSASGSDSDDDSDGTLIVV